MEKKSTIIVKDIPLSRLTATNQKKFSNEEIAPVRRSMEAVEMLEPLVVCEKGETFLISDGNKRYNILCDAGIESAPCILTPHLDTYTASRQVIDVSPAEREKMIDKVREKVTDDKVAAAIGKLSLKPGIDKSLEDKLHAVVKTAFEGRKLSKAALYELKNVTLKRQAEILRELKQMKSYNLDMIRAKILLTPPAERIVQEQQNPWKKSDEKRDLMTKRLRVLSEENVLMEHQHITFVGDLIKMSAYMRGCLNHEPIRQYITKNYPDMYKRICEIMDRER